MLPSKDLEFTVFHSAGKNYAVIINLKPNNIDWSVVAPRLACPHIGLGVDGLLLVHPSKERDFDIVAYRTGGIPVPFSANGLAAVTRALALTKVIDPQRGSIEYTIDGRAVHCSFVQGGREVTVDMGKPSFEPLEIALSMDKSPIEMELSIGSQLLTVTALSLIEPFAVITGPDPDLFDLHEVATELNANQVFSAGVNVVALVKLTEDSIRISSWERGHGLQPPSALAACAAMVAGVKAHKCVRRTRVLLGQEEVTITWASDDARIQRSGRVLELYAGTLFDSYLSSIV